MLPKPFSIAAWIGSLYENAVFSFRFSVFSKKVVAQTFYLGPLLFDVYVSLCRPGMMVGNIKNRRQTADNVFPGVKIF
jgi:hypothetical protein